ncbi:MAG: YebC/PmpR family DNA-binding transcriptional regulator [Gammaproteobacteria bacterium]|nr:YebC/PmpR family DNA-binding transcriptional regulator [Gammaproteobacteria bacterium]
MAGHSKWANIQHRKQAQDHKKGKLFTKLIREITVAARQGGADPKTNSRLRDAIVEANDHNMPKDTIERAIKRGRGEGSEEERLEEVRYEGYGPSGIAFVVDCLTSNRNRTVSEVRLVFTTFGGNIGTSGSVSYLFSKKGILTFPPGVDENKLTEVAIEVGAEDILVNEDKSIDVITAPEYFSSIRDEFSNKGFQSGQAAMTEVPSLWVSVTGEVAEKIEKMVDELEALDDVQKVYTNAECGVRNENLYVLGIDPGSRITGYGILKVEGREIHPIASGCITTQKESLAERLSEITSGVETLLSRHPAVREVAVERVFMHRNVDSALKLGHARGAILVSIANRFLPIHEYSAREIKKAVVGQGGADKKQVQYMVACVLGLKGKIQADAADALAVALCHIHTQQGLSRVDKASAFCERSTKGTSV